MDILDILLPLDTFCVNLVHFSCLGILHPEKSGKPGLDQTILLLTIKNTKL
jgi:hypothetical protein